MRAATAALTHSPIRGNCILEADPGIAQAVDGELRSADRIISRPGALHILARGLDAQSEDPGDLPIRLAAGDEPQALDLAPAEPRALTRPRKAPQPPRRAKRVCADGSGAFEAKSGNIASGPDCERAGCARLAGNVGRDGETIANAMAPAPREDPPVATLKRDEGRQLGPGEPDVRPSAREMDGIVVEEPGQGPLLNPGFGVIVDAEFSGASGGEAGMVDEGEMIKPKLERGVAQERPKLQDSRHGPGGFSELIAQPPHRSGRFARYASLCPRAHFLLTCRRRILFKRVTNK